MSWPEMPGLDDVRRIVLDFHHLPVEELQAEILVEQHDAADHVVEHGLHDLARALDVVARGFGGLLGGRERFLAILQFGDVAVDREQAAVVQRLEGELDVLAARGAALVACAGAHDRDPARDLLVDAGFRDRAEIAAPRLELEDRLGGNAGTRQVSEKRWNSLS